MFKKKLSCKSFVLLSLLFLSAFTGKGSLLWGRDVSVTVEDLNLELPLEGAVIHSWDGEEYGCDENGTAVISVPDGRQVFIQVTYPGYETGRLIIPLRGDSFTLGMRIGGMLESREIVIEAPRPGASETRSGRSVAISGETLERSSQIGLIEDVMTSIKLLPGVGYTGMFNALPSIRGGDPGDLTAVLDGFYIENPYHWGGGFSIFDPHMAESAQLSHGIFSSRYGHTVSGLLEVTSKKASPDYAELELGVSTSAVNLNAAFPLGSGGGLMLMGKVTYWDPFVWALQGLSEVWDNETLQMINAVTAAPYIRSTAASFNYRFNSDLEINANAFLGTDGVGADYPTEVLDPEVRYRLHGVFDFNNLKAFFISGLTYNPLPSMLLSATAGAGYDEAKILARMNYDYLSVTTPFFSYTLDGNYLNTDILAVQSNANAQGRLDFDFSPGKGFLLAAGAQELYSVLVSEQEGNYFIEQRRQGPLPPYFSAGEVFYVHYPVHGKMPETRNETFNSSAYILGEYISPRNFFGAELGLRMDHFYFLEKDFNIQTMPVYNPRLNLDFNVLSGGGIFESLDITVGTGLFSSINDAIRFISPNAGIGDFEIKPNRSWTSVFGVRTDLTTGWSFNLEGYYKYVFDMAYQYSIVEPGKNTRTVYRFNGEGIVWGFDLMLQKFESRYWDGWLSYTFTNARYHEPERPSRELDSSGASRIENPPWYYPSFHRFHNLNLVLNFKPASRYSIYVRLGLASGRPKSVVGEIEEYDMILLDESGSPVTDPNDPSSPMMIKTYRRSSSYSDDSRTTWSIPLDIKFSYAFFNEGSKVQTEIYIAGENLLSLVYVAQSNTRFNSYTGREDTGSDSANYEMPVPMVSVGMKWSF